MEATSLHAFEAEGANELSFADQVTLIVLENKDVDWALAEYEGQVGYVPRNRIYIHPADWYLGEISRQNAEDLLLQRRLQGCFLIRDGMSIPGTFSLSVFHQGRVEHFKVLKQHAQYWLWVSKTFSSLNALVEYYQQHSVSQTDPSMILTESVTSTGDNSNDMYANAEQLQAASAMNNNMNNNMMGGQPQMMPGMGGGNIVPQGSFSRTQQSPQQQQPYMQQQPNQQAPPPMKQQQMQQPPAPMPKKMKALYAYSAQQDGELDFQAGEEITVLEEYEEYWWIGTIGTRAPGLFPPSYCQLIN